MNGLGGSISPHRACILYSSMTLIRGREPRTTKIAVHECGKGPIVAYDHLAAFNEAYWWARAALTLAFVWLLVDLLRKAPWARVGLKLALATACASVAVFYYWLYLPPVTRGASELAGVWIPGVRGGAFLLIALIGVFDAAYDSTPLQVPQGGWRLAAVISLLAAGISFPILDLLAGHTPPSTHYYGISPLPTILVIMGMLSASRPRGFYGTLWLSLAILIGLDTGVISPILTGHYHHFVGGAAAVLAVLVAVSPDTVPARADTQGAL